MDSMLNLTETSIPGTGFYAMGNENHSFMKYLGNTFFINCAIVGLYLIYLCLYFVRCNNCGVKKVKSKL